MDEKMEELQSLRVQNKILQNQVDALSALVTKKGIENQESLLVALMGNRQPSGGSPPLFKFLQKILNEVQTLTPFISKRALKEDVENEAKYEVARKNILDSYHQDLRSNLRHKLKQYSVIQIQGDQETHVFNFNGQSAEGSEKVI